MCAVILQSNWPKNFFPRSNTWIDFYTILKACFWCWKLYTPGRYFDNLSGHLHSTKASRANGLLSIRQCQQQCKVHFLLPWRAPEVRSRYFKCLFTVCPRKKLSKFWRHVAQKVTRIWQYPFVEQNVVIFLICVRNMINIHWSLHKI